MMYRLQKFTNSHEIIIDEDDLPANWNPTFDDTIQSRISVFPGDVRNTSNPVHTDLLHVYKAIRYPKYKKQTETLRAIKDPAKNRQYKAGNFSYATFSGLFRERSNANLIEHSGLICIDIDKLPDLNKVREDLSKDTHTVMVFTSPNGNGLKLIIKIEPDPDKQKLFYEAIRDYLIEKYKIPVDCIDKQCSDVSRACFLPYDPNIFLNPLLTENLIVTWE